MQVISLFSGIGGFELAAEWMGWENIVSCEINPFGRKVLEHYWPHAYHHDDVHTLTYTRINEEIKKRKGADWRTDDIVLVGGFPCQPYSQAGKRLGKDDQRHLWPQMLRIISEVKPTYIVGENVYGLVNWSDGLVFEEVCADLEAKGYEVQPVLLPASGIGAPHQRMRCWFVAYAHQSGREERHDSRERAHQAQVAAGMDDRAKRFSEDGNAPDTGGGRISGYRRESARKQLQAEESHTNHCQQFRRVGWEQFPTVSPICSRNDGLSNRLDGITFPKWRNESIKAYGNAIVPQVVYQIFKCLEAMK